MKLQLAVLSRTLRKERVLISVRLFPGLIKVKEKKKTTEKETMESFSVYFWTYKVWCKADNQWAQLLVLAGMLTSAIRWDKLIFMCFWIFMKYNMHEKDTTVAWGYHKGVIIDTIIKTIIVYHRFIIYNSSVWWMYLFAFSVKAFRSKLPFMCSNRQSTYWFSLFPYNFRKTQAFFFFFFTDSWVPPWPQYSEEAEHCLALIHTHLRLASSWRS